MYAFEAGVPGSGCPWSPVQFVQQDRVPGSRWHFVRNLEGLPEQLLRTEVAWASCNWQPPTLSPGEMPLSQENWDVLLICVRSSRSSCEAARARGREAGQSPERRCSHRDPAGGPQRGCVLGT